MRESGELSEKFVKFIFTYLGLEDLFSKQRGRSNSMGLHIIRPKFYYEYFASFTAAGFLALATQNGLQFLL